MSVYVRARGKQQQQQQQQYQVRIRHPLIPGTNHELYFTFNDKETALEYGKNLQACLDKGVVPFALKEEPRDVDKCWSIKQCIDGYLEDENVIQSDVDLLMTISKTEGEVMTSTLSYKWVKAWIRSMKREKFLVPGTIRHRCGALARCLDWLAKTEPSMIEINPLRLLKKGYSAYSEGDMAAAIANGGASKIDRERDRRLEIDEAHRLLGALKTEPELELLHHISLETAMRMREIYTLTIQQIRFDQRTIFLRGTKNGDTRQVPMSGPIHKILTDYIAKNREAISARSGRLFSFWRGETSKKMLNSISSRISLLYAKFVKTVGIVDFHFHDLRHEAICQLFLRTQYSDVTIARITGHRDLRMLRRYASLRGSELAGGMWGWNEAA